MFQFLLRFISWISLAQTVLSKLQAQPPFGERYVISHPG
jgi:hypothetical protein